MPSTPADPRPAGPPPDTGASYDREAAAPIAAGDHTQSRSAPARTNTGQLPGRHTCPGITDSRRCPALGVALTALADADLIERARSDPEAFGVLYERYVNSVFGFVFGKVRDRTQAEDITSQTFLQALRALPQDAAMGRANP